MALSALRLRRTLTLTSSSSLIRSYRSLYSLSSSLSIEMISSPPAPSNPTRNYMKNQICWFRSSLPCASSRSSSYNNKNDDDMISPDTILFEGCDYNHWLITMDFPKDPKPTPDEMVETYVQTLAKVVGSVEEAKKRMYACSTTTYNGFQAVMTEEMSEKFKGLPGVVFILPDSYIDPVNKEYGGDKYINGTIIPRPPPVQYGRQHRYGDRNRNRPGSPQRDERNYGVQQNYGSPQNSGPAAPGDGRNYGAQQNYPPQRNMGPDPTGQGDGRSFGAQHSYVTQQNYGPSPTGRGERGDPMPMGNMDYVPGGRDNYQGQQSDPIPSHQRDFPQVGRRDFAPENRDFRGDNRNFSPPPAGDYRQGVGSSYGQSYPVHGEGQRFPQMEQRDDIQREQRNFTPVGQRKHDQEGGY